MMTRIGIAVAVCVALVLPGTASAAWEAPQAISVDGKSVSPASGAQGVDAVAGSSGLATALFFLQGQDSAFLTRRSHEQKTWSTAQGVPVPAGTASGYSALAGNAAGDAFAIWGNGQNATLMNAATWLAAAPVPGSALPALGGIWPDMAMDGAGNAYAVTRHPDGRILFARFDAASGVWSPQRELSPAASTSFDVQPRVAANEAGDVAVVYAKLFGEESRLVGHRLYAGQTELSAGQPLDEEGNDVGPASAVAIDGEGAVTAVFTQGETGQEQIYATRWTRGAAPSGHDELISGPREAHFPAERPQVVADAAGRVTAVWLQLEGPNKAHLYSAERVDEAGFAFPQRITSANEDLTSDESSNPPGEPSPEDERSVRSASYDLAVDEDGTATIAFVDAADLTGLVDADVKASRRASGGTWTEPVSLTSPGPGRVAQGAITPAVAAARPGQVDVVFAEIHTAEEHDVSGIGGTVELLATRFEGPPPPAASHQTLVRSSDDTGILVQWCPAAGLEGGERAPTIIAGSGWGIPGRRCPGANTPEEEIEGVFGSTPVKSFIDAGYNVLTFDARGFWRSGGTAQVDSPEYEGKDMQALIDYVARQPNALLDGAGDPRLGMAGGSYGGGIQLVTAAIDHRVDAIAPAISWNSLVTSLFPRETVKAGWAAILVGAGVPTTALPGVLSPAGIQSPDMDMADEVYTATRTAAHAGTIDPGTRSWFERRGPHHLLGQIDTPTLIIQGTVDTLFPLDEAHRNFEALRAAGTEVKMLWFCGGHGACERQGEDQAHIDQRVLAWFDRHLRASDVSTGPLFEWVDEDGRWHESASYPPTQEVVVRGSGSGTLSLSPGELPGSGGVIFATPYTFGGADHPAAVEVPITAPPSGAAVVGAPQLRLRYSATGVSTYGTGVDGAAANRTYVYAQIVDNRRHRVVGNQATPIPITLDGEEHELSLALERIASQATSAGYSLQIVPQTSVYDGQRAAGRVELQAIDVELPLVGAADVLPATAPVSPVGQTQPRTDPRPAVRRPTCRGVPATITGTPGSDVISGTRRRDVIVALGGNDTIVARRGADLVCAGGGRDVVHGQRGADELRGGTGNDRLVGGAGRDALAGDRGHDVLRGQAGNDRLSGGRGRDRLTGGPGRDRLLGGSGRDLLRADPRDLRVLGGSGLDRIAGLR